MLGINSWSLKNNFDDLLETSNYGLFESYECAKPFYMANIKRLSKINLKCSCLSSLIVGDYDLSNKLDINDFILEFKESCLMALDLGAKKMMFGLSRLRKNMTPDKVKLFKELVYIADSSNLKLLYEAIPGDEFIKNHDELIDFSKSVDLNEIHVDFNTIIKNNESYNNICNKIKVSNAHYPVGIPLRHFSSECDVSLENYNNYSNQEVKKWIKSLL